MSWLRQWRVSVERVTHWRQKRRRRLDARAEMAGCVINKRYNKIFATIISTVGRSIFRFWLSLYLVLGGRAIHWDWLTDKRRVGRSAAASNKLPHICNPVGKGSAAMAGWTVTDSCHEEQSSCILSANRCHWNWSHFNRCHQTGRNDGDDKNVINYALFGLSTKQRCYGGGSSDLERAWGTCSTCWLSAH